MSLGEELCYKAHEMEVEEDFYSYEFSNDEGLPVYKDSEEVFAALRQKEDEVLLAAQVGNALLLENRQLKQERDALHDKHAQQLEELEQGRYELRVKLEDCRVQWESQVSELERDVQELQARVERLSQSLSEAEREKSRLKQEHSEHSHRLREQLQRGMEVERAMTSELQRLKEEMRERGQARPQDEEIINALREQVARLTQREQTLEQRLKMTCHENEELKDTMSTLHARLDLQEQQSHTHIQQLAEAWREVDGVRSRAQELQSQVEELQEEVALQEKSHNDSSLLSELENNLDAADWSLDKEQQVCRELHYILVLLQPVAYRSEAEQDSDDSLQGMLGQLKHAAQWIAHSETLQEKRKSIVGSVSDPCENAIRIKELQDQNERLVAENAKLKLRAERLVEQEVVQQAIKDRDDAITKKTAMEAELLRTKHDMMCLNNQLLEAIQRKLQLSQELEAWQDDIQIIINQQLRNQQQTEEPQKRSAGRLSFLRKSRRPSTLPEISPEQNQTPWRDWLKRSK
ncbi:BICD family-like cargo adapter 1 isoform X1 [Cyprinus carpio]|uniref:BICD family-like cargo adapter 1 isoform X1 n=1 Tax=Cyprinus carpio TaxID=7962 RepID=A0A9Q9X472_CYPCA|nr:BICD family-like cargo adapter 1 isoform X1 [Cyprinus carpio]